MSQAPQSSATESLNPEDFKFLRSITFYCALLFLANVWVISKGTEGFLIFIGSIFVHVMILWAGVIVVETVIANAIVRARKMLS